MKLMTPEEFYSYTPRLDIIKGYAEELLAFVSKKELEIEEKEKKGKSKKTK